MVVGPAFDLAVNFLALAFMIFTGGWHKFKRRSA